MKNSESQEEYEIDFERVVELVFKYEQIKKSGEIKKYNEESTKKDFILPLFEALGWNVYNRAKRNDSISAEETISKKRVDYGFRINGIPKFFLEAKSLKEENIHTNHEYITQAIDYAWMKSCSWAILCNFETIAVYNADWKGSNFGNNFLFALHPSDFLSDKRFERLSKQAFVNKELDKSASDYGKKQTKNPINQQLLQDMIHFREILSKDILRNNQARHLSQDDLDESVQRILDRLIFIRNAEDRELEENRLQSNVRQWASRGKGQLVKEISKVYSYFDEQYNSKLFEKRLCDELYLDNEVLLEVIEGLNHSFDNSYRYDFSIIESDVLGNIYEQYLGNILKSTPKRAKLSESRTHRKEQGIYYTPSYIVDHIVKNTVGEYIKTHTPDEIKNVKILDPACGSGSFLIRAYQELESYWIKELKLNEGDVKQTRFDLNNSDQFYTLKTDILRNNIFGVDLDPKAVEIAQLNLLLQISERKHKLPILQNNIKVGNSVIDDPTVNHRALKWDREFHEIVKDGGFDVVIGNPPYVRNTELSIEDKNFFSESYKSTEKQYDLYIIFIEKAISLLHNNGFFGYIIPNKVLSADYARKLREIILGDCEIPKITDVSNLPVFKDAATYPIILILRKKKAELSSKVGIKICNNEEEISDGYDYRIKQNRFEQAGNYQFLIHADQKKSEILDKIEARSNVLGEIFEIRKGIETGNDKERTFISEIKPSNGDAKPVLGANTIRRYFIEWNGRYVIYNPAILNGARKSEYFERPKLVTGRTVKRLSFALDNDRFYTLDTTQILFPKAKIDLYGILGLINSKLINFYYTIKFQDSHMQGGYIRCYTNYLEKIPIIKDMALLNDVGILSKKITQKRKELLDLDGKKTDKSVMLETEIRDADDEIDKIVYELYGIDENEKKIIEENETA